MHNELSSFNRTQAHRSLENLEVQAQPFESHEIWAQNKMTHYLDDGVDDVIVAGWWLDADGETGVEAVDDVAPGI